jgi:hypothetical protein
MVVTVDLVSHESGKSRWISCDIKSIFVRIIENARDDREPLEKISGEINLSDKISFSWNKKED